MAAILRMMLSASIALALILFSALTAEATASCPSKPLGVSEANSDDGITYYATAVVRPLSTDRDMIEDAKKDAFLASKILLKRDSRIPRAKNGVLYGVQDDGLCDTDGRIYATVSINEKSARQAIKLQEQISLSLSKNPTTGQQSYFWVDDGEKKRSRRH